MQQSERDGFWICNEVVYSYAGSDYKLLSYYLAVWQKAPQQALLQLAAAPTMPWKGKKADADGVCIHAKRQ